jgi:hypothetical protein
MSINTNFNANPYYDDFDADKKHLRMLFKPGYAVQARELTQLQTALQNQTSLFGKHVFRNGSRVSPGAGQTRQIVTYLKLNSSYSSIAVSVNNFDNKTIYSNDGSKRAKVIKTYDADLGTGDPITLMVVQDIGDVFVAGETIKTDETSPAYATIATSGVGNGLTFSIDEGIWFYEGFFVKNDKQTIAVSKYTTNANAKVGFEITEEISTSNDDTSLLDPALDASNYQAPGADRFIINFTLASRSLDSTDTTQFIEVARFVNGNLITLKDSPEYAVLADEFARRTYDESGNYTVQPFLITLSDNTSNTAQSNISLSTGTAYVYGYEVRKKFPENIIVDKPRETISVNNKNISADYGEYVYTKNHVGSLPIDSLTTMDVHCVPTANDATTAIYSNTKIGTVRIKSYIYDSGNTQNAQTYVYRTTLFDVNINNSITGNVNTATATTLTIGNTVAGLYYSNVADAYAGAKLRITTGTGSDEAPKTITSFNTTTQTLTFSTADSFVSIPTSTSKFSIDFEFNDAESFASLNGSSKIVSSAQIDNFSKDFASTYQDAYISDTALEPLIFKLGEDWIANNSVTDISYTYKRLYTSQSFTSSQSPALTLQSGESLVNVSTSSAKAENYLITVTTQGTSPYGVGQTVPATAITVDTSTKKITVASGGNMVANIIATIDSSSPSAKVKTYVTCNPCVQTSANGSGSGASGNQTANVDSGAALVYGTQGQTTIAAASVNKTPGTAQSLYVTDVTQLVQVLDFNGAAVANTGGTDITSKYTLTSGQKDSYYDHSSIVLKGGVTPPVGPIVVRYNRYTSSGTGFFTNTSYIPNYSIIPSYTSQAGTVYSLRDCFDFRPVRSDAAGAYTSGTVTFDLTSSAIGSEIPNIGSSIRADYSYYMPRIDRVVVHKNGTFEVVKGQSSLNPIEPLNPSDAMSIYILHNPPYVANTANISVEYVENKRYTMRDIGVIEKRVENLEYYTTLSLIEQDTLNKQDFSILDTTNLPRFKNGIITDSFRGQSVMDFENLDFKASIDSINKEMRPSVNVHQYGLQYDTANSIDCLDSGQFITISANSIAFVEQNLASGIIEVNPFQVVKFLGRIKLNPASDNWIDTERGADVNADLSGDLDAWKKITDRIPTDIVYGAWIDTGIKSPVSTSWWASGGTFTSTGQNVTQQRQGIISTVVPKQITATLGDKVVNLSVIPYMRSNRVYFYASNFKPLATLYPFFDVGNRAVENYVQRANRFLIDKGGLLFHCGLGTPEKINVSNTITSTVINVVKTAQNSGNSVFTFNTVEVPGASFIGNTKITGQESGLTANVVGYEHFSGNVVSATGTSIVLSIDASGANNETWYANTSNSTTVFIVAGTGAGQQRTISAYNAATRNLSVTSAWTTTPTSNSIYSIGRLTTTRNGDISGIFYIPSGQFKTGAKPFVLMDTSTGDFPSCTTSGDTNYYAQGILETLQKETITTIAPVTERTSVNQTQVVFNGTTTFSADPSVASTSGCDPLAETFFVSPQTYPDGIMLDKIRICFAEKDDVIPVTVQIRPAVNGYPSTFVGYTFAEVTLTPDKVIAIGSNGIPDLDDATKYTEFVLDAPVYLKAGEHSFVVMANSEKYKVFYATQTLNNLADGVNISKQPYIGSMFKSQNASTWETDQNSDLMFRLYRKSFDTTKTGYASFALKDVPTSNTVFDTLSLLSSEIVVANTSLQYEFQSYKSTGGLAGYKTINPIYDYQCNDDGDRRVLDPSIGARTFILRATMNSTNEAVSPILDATRFGSIFVENIINNMPLLNTGFIIGSTGSGYAGNASVTISGGNGSGANAYAVANVTSGTITGIVVDTPGSGYTTSPTITISGNATATYNGEDAKSGGNAYSRYIARKVTLADGFESGDLRVFLTAYKPSGSNIYVYYKLLSKSDTDTFDNKSWQLMAQLGNENYVSSSPTDYRELTFAPGTNGTANNTVSYTSGTSTFTKFKTFAIKIVLTGTSTTDVPKVRDFRGIALPAGA